ncbi:MAG: alpha/beta fold hydrolase [Roseovarius sp.]|nr:alpha/beta fold hydrolase [Roseovarius sp.]
MTQVILNCTKHGQEERGKPGLLIVHGLYGSARNWGVVAKRLSDARHVVAVDVRNHGSSPWFETHSYHDMADDLADSITSLGGSWDVLGHSMGGKAAMVLALTSPELVNRLMVADIAPVKYGHSQIQHINSMKGVDVSLVKNRSDVANQLSGTIDDMSLISFFAQSFDMREKVWRLNLDTLAREMPKILDFPYLETEYSKPALFLSGANSDYVKREHREIIRRLFPASQFAKIPGTGHWLHSEKPREFEAAIRVWLG